MKSPKMIKLIIKTQEAKKKQRKQKAKLPQNFAVCNRYANLDCHRYAYENKMCCSLLTTLIAIPIHGHAINVP
jgi:hypothetical protein